MAAEISIEEALVVERIRRSASSYDEPDEPDDEDPEADRFDEAEAVALDEPADLGRATGASRSRSPTRSTSSRRRRTPARRTSIPTRAPPRSPRRAAAGACGSRRAASR